MQRTARTTPLAGTAALLLVAGTAAAQTDWLALCGKCLNPSIVSKSGIGTANAVAEARISRQDAEGWCANWAPGQNLAACVREQLATEEARRTYRASADCTRGRITAIDGSPYTLAGTWSSDVGKGRSKWRDASGRIVGQDNASNGLAISQQWEVLCPGGTRATPAPAPRVTTPAPAPRAAPGGVFAVGQAVDARYGGAWVRGRVIRIHPGAGQVEYEIRLDNGQRGIVPAQMLRPAGG